MFLNNIFLIFGQLDKLEWVIEELTLSVKQTYQDDALQQLELADGNRINWLHYGSGHTLGITYNGKTVSDFERDKFHREPKAP